MRGRTALCGEEVETVPHSWTPTSVADAPPLMVSRVQAGRPLPTHQRTEPVGRSPQATGPATVSWHPITCGRYQAAVVARFSDVNVARPVAAGDVRRQQISSEAYSAHIRVANVVARRRDASGVAVRADFDPTGDQPLQLTLGGCTKRWWSDHELVIVWPASNGHAASDMMGRLAVVVDFAMGRCPVSASSRVPGHHRARIPAASRVESV